MSITFWIKRLIIAFWKADPGIYGRFCENDFYNLNVKQIDFGKEKSLRLKRSKNSLLAAFAAENEQFESNDIGAAESPCFFLFVTQNGLEVFKGRGRHFLKKKRESESYFKLGGFRSCRFSSN